MSAGQSYWMKDLQRVSKVVSVLSKHGFDYWLSRDDVKAYLGPVQRFFHHKRSVPPVNPYVNFRRALEELGGTYVKLGQLLSIRPDLVPVDLTIELQKLQDRVEPVPYEQIKAVVEEELKKPIGTYFKHFDKKPLAAASIGQVHRAELLTGEKVVVKVQRPHVQELMETDIDIMRYIAAMAERRNKTIYRFSPNRILDEFERYTKEELNYLREGKNADTFRKNIGAEKSVVIPKVYWSHTTKRVLTMEFIDGRKLSELGAKERVTMRHMLDSCNKVLLKEIFEDGFFHADLHPGNILLTKDKKLALLDFGIVGHFDDELRATSLKMFLGMLKCDASMSVEALLELGRPSEKTDIREFKRAISDELGRWYGSSLGEYHITHLMHKFLDIAYEYDVKMPPDLVLFAKALVTMEGTALEFDPEFDFITSSKPYMRQLLHKKYAPKNMIREFLKETEKARKELTAIPRNMNDVLQKIREGTIRIDMEDAEIHRLGVELDRSSNRLVYGMVIAALIVAGALFSDVQLGPKMFGYPALATLCILLAFFMGFILLESIRNERRVERA